MADLIYDEMHLFAICFTLGIALGFCYDILRVFRLFIHHREILVDLEDLVYWIFTAWLVFETLFYFNKGALRSYAFLGMFLGVIAYMCTVSRLILFVAKKCVPPVEKGKQILKRPFISFGKIVRKALKNIQADVKMAIKGR